MQPLFAKKNRGQYKGQFLYPHLHSDGTYVATPSRYSVDYIRVNSIEELSALVSAGYGARMSNPDIRQAPSFISNARILFAQQENPLQRLKRALMSFSKTGELDDKTIANSRKEQAFLRAYLLRAQAKGNCVLCEQRLPAELLIAAHIKPRSKCTPNERLDFDNVAALMCLLGCDSLFEKGFIYVSDGKVQTNKQRAETPYLKARIDRLLGKTVANWPNSSAYYQWHAKQFN